MHECQTFFDKSVVKYQIFRSIPVNQPIMGVNEDMIAGFVKNAFPGFYVSGVSIQERDNKSL